MTLASTRMARVGQVKCQQVKGRKTRNADKARPCSTLKQPPIRLAIETAIRSGLHDAC